MRFASLLFLLLWILPAAAQQKALIAGPMAGSVELRDVIIWLEAGSAVKQAAIRYYEKGKPAAARTERFTGELGKRYNPVKIQLVNLEPGTAYEYEVLLDGKAVKRSAFTTKTLWQYRQPAPDFSFLTGSCAYFNEPAYDRPGKPYGNDSSIFETMAAVPADFMMWLGDNWYTRDADFHSVPGLQYRAHRDRSLPVLQRFLQAMPHYAVWDDHDYGPNNANKSYIFRDQSREVFSQYWPNPSFGEEGKGIYTRYSFSDVDFFLLDGRYWSSAGELPDSINGQPNPTKKMYGDQQMEWLKNALLTSNASFKIIVTGSQALNPISIFDSFHHFPVEYHDFMNFLDQNHIPGILFLTGDRHHSEVIKLPRENNYPLYDITSSPLTSGVGGVLLGNEKNNPYRVPGTLVVTQNFARISVSGPKGGRWLKLEFMDKGKQVLGNFEVNQQELMK
ncbi:alkaline phosphatase D family protein [Chitinophaga sp. YIM B06452]|uniref:alkaline phosphatase D family protein n=1 Tax=Chitinophaga sp. YIM B06452 TaxID=3082158 RepID=UPI0031FED9FB